MNLFSGFEYTKECVQNICKDVKESIISGGSLVSSWVNQHVSGSPEELHTADKKKSIDFVPLAQSKGVWSELRKEHEQLSIEHERSREEFRNLRQVITQLQNDYQCAKDNLIFRRYTLLKAMIKRCVVYIHLRRDSGGGEALSTAKQRQEMRNREESISSLSRQELTTLNKQLQGMTREYKCKTGLILDSLQTLERNYQQSKQYSAFRRYRMLKSIVKSVIHNQWLQ